MLVTLLERASQVSGDVAECGVFRGHTALALGLVIKEKGLAKMVYALDSFQGFDDVANREAKYLGSVENPALRAGAFSETSLELIERKIRLANLEGVVVPVRGYFRDTLPRLPDREYCFVHLDCDLAESYTECLEYFYPHLTPGGYICFDEYQIQAWPLTTQAIDMFFRDKPEKPIELIERIGGRRCSRWHIRKLPAVTGGND
jgi:hypothetical protein